MSRLGVGSGLVGGPDGGEAGDVGYDVDLLAGVVRILIDGVEVVDDLLPGVGQGSDLGVVVVVDLELPATRPTIRGDRQCRHPTPLNCSQCIPNDFGGDLWVRVITTLTPPLRHTS